MFGTIAAHAIVILAASGLGALITYVCCCLHCEHAHHIEVEIPPRQR